MSLDRFNFKWTPPQTVERAPRESVPAAAADKAAALAAPPLAETRVGQLLQTCQDLQATAKYLESVILARSAGLTMNIAGERYPEVHMALTRMYPDNPEAITVEMYNHMLDLEMAHTQLDIAIPLDDEKEVSMYQKADLMVSTKAFEKAIIDRGEYKYQLPLMLRGLKTDRLIARNWAYSLQQYPVFRTQGMVAGPGVAGVVNTQLARTDVSDALAKQLQGASDSLFHEYGRVYNLLGQVSHVEADIVNLANLYFYEPVDNIIRMAQAFNALKTFATKQGLEGLMDSLTNFAFARLNAELSDLMFMGDRFLQNITAPLKDSLSKIGQLTRTVQQIGGDIGYVIDGGLKGQLKGSMCGESRSVTDPLTGDQVSTGVGFVSNSVKQHIQDGVDTVDGAMGKAEAWLNGKMDGATDGLKSLAEHLDWSNRLMDAKQASLTQEFQKLMDRRTGEKGSMTELLCSMRALDSFVNMAKGFVQAKRSSSGSTAAAQPSTAQRLETVGHILTNLDTGTGTKFAIQDGEVEITPPDMPEPGATVQRGLSRGGLDIKLKSDLLRVHLEGNNAQ